MIDKDFRHLFSDEERAFMKHLLSLVRQSEAEGTDNEQAFLDMEVAGERFDEVHGEGSVRSIFSRARQAIAVKERVRICAMRALSGSKAGDLASWLNSADTEFLAQIGITL
jgi:hypothetical protein